MENNGRNGNYRSPFVPLFSICALISLPLFHYFRLLRMLYSAMDNRRSDWIGKFAIMAAFAGMLLISWRRWESPIIDSGRELDLPLRLLRGEMLYRDVHYLYPPLPPYFNSLLYRLFSVHLDVLQGAGIFCALLVVVLSYRIARRVLPPLESSLATLMIILFSVFKPAGNLIFPYAFAALYGMVFSLAALLFILRYVENRQRRELLAAGTLIGLAAVSKLEFSFAAAITVMATLVYLHRSRIKDLITDSLYSAAPIAVIAIPVYGYFFYYVSPRTLIEDCHLFYTHLPQSLVIYNAKRTGLDKPLSSLAQMLGGAAVGISTLSVVALASLWKTARQSKIGLTGQARRVLLWSGIALAAASTVIFITRMAQRPNWDGSPLRALPLLLLGLIVINWYREREGSPSLFIVSFYSLAILARVALRVPSGGAFGSFFLPTSLILIVYLLTSFLPNLIARWADLPHTGHFARKVGHLLLLLLAVISIVVFTVRYRKNYRFEVHTPRGNFYTRADVGAAMQQAIDYLRSQTAPDEAIAVFPEGSDLTFLSNRRMPFRYPILHPDFIDEQGERRAIDQLQRENVRYILIVNRSMAEFGAKVFGRDYNPLLGQWIEENYQLVKVCGENPDPSLRIGDPDFFIKIFSALSLQSGTSDNRSR
jgi:Dolichyl-phosphate-mannose-protein mannosyltransferase